MIMKIECIDKKSKLFPDKLKQLEKCPNQIFFQGNKQILSEFSLGVIGSRNCSVLGKTIAQNISEELAEKDITIISGLARGVDTIAHKACVENNSKTIAVLGGGHNRIYPSENRKLAEDIIQKGGVIISEYPPEYPPLKNNFRERNRIIAALSDGIILIEAKKNSGSLITVKHAEKLNKKIFVVPGRICDEEYEGSNLILKNGAFCVRNASDVIEKYENIKAINKIEKSKNIEIDAELKKVYDSLSFLPQTIEDVSLKVKESVGQITSKIILLEMSNLIKRVNGEFFVKTKNM